MVPRPEVEAFYLSMIFQAARMEAGAYHRTAVGYEVESAGDERRRAAADRSVWFQPGQVNRLVEAHFRFDEPSDYERFPRVHVLGGTAQVEPGRAEASLNDPDGCLLHFRLGEPFSSTGASGLPPGRLAACSTTRFARPAPRHWRTSMRISLASRCPTGYATLQAT